MIKLGDYSEEEAKKLISDLRKAGIKYDTRSHFTSPPHVAAFNIKGPIWNKGCNDASCWNGHQITDQCLEENQ